MRVRERAGHLARYFVEWEGKTAVSFFGFSRWILVSLEMADDLSYSQIQAAWEIFQFPVATWFFPNDSVSFKAKHLVNWSQNIFFRALQRLVQLVQCDEKCLLSRWVCSYSLSPKHLIKSGLLCLFKYFCNLPFSPHILYIYAYAKYVGFCRSQIYVVWVSEKSLSNWFGITEIFFSFFLTINAESFILIIDGIPINAGISIPLRLLFSDLMAPH